MSDAPSSGAAGLLAGAWKGRRCGAAADTGAAAAYCCAGGPAAAAAGACGLGRGALKAGRLPLPPLPRSTTPGGRGFRAAAAGAGAGAAAAGTAAASPPPPPPPWISLGEQGASTATTMLCPKLRATSSPSARTSPSCRHRGQRRTEKLTPGQAGQRLDGPLQHAKVGQATVVYGRQVGAGGRWAVNRTCRRPRATTLPLSSYSLASRPFCVTKPSSLHPGRSQPDRKWMGWQGWQGIVGAGGSDECWP